MRTLLRLIFAAALLSPLPAEAASPQSLKTPSIASVTIHTAQAGPTINRDIFGQFAEHLGQGIYGGVWVGRNSTIPNVRGIRHDVVNALRAIHVPLVRWPGGCFADQYHWRYGIGPESARVPSVNANWGGTLEPNTFGTDEFMDFLAQIGSEAYVNLNVGTGSPQEAAEWLEYMTTTQPSALGKQRVANGHKAPYKIKFVGLGNESWGCGGAMSAAQYVEHMRAFSLYARNFNPAQAGPSRWQRGLDSMQRIAVGPQDFDTSYTDAVMTAALKSAPWSWGIEALSVHYYVMGSKPMRSPSNDFDENEYAVTVKQALAIEKMIASTATIMDKTDPNKRIGISVDEWGDWLEPQTGTNPSFLSQGNSMRDAILASLNLDIFARHADRVRVANIAQMVNVLQAMIQTDGAKMLLTPSYYVFKMYVPFQDAEILPVSLTAGAFTAGNTELPQVDGLAARGKDHKIWLAVTNIDPSHTADLAVTIDDSSPSETHGETLTAPRFDVGNTFDSAAVTPRPLNADIVDGRLVLHLPPASVSVVAIEP